MQDDAGMDVVVWNMAHKTKNWPALQELAADIGILNEATPAPDGVVAVGHGETIGRDGYPRRWSTAVVATHLIREVEDAAASRYGRRLELPFVNSRPGSWAAAVVSVPGFDDVTSISLYGLLDEKSDTSIHRSLSELAPIFDDKRYNRFLLLGGDLNTWTGWKAGSWHLARDQVVFDRIRAYGLIDCLERTRKAGHLKNCPCSFGTLCTHTRTRLDPRKPDVPYQMDYLFASRALAERLESCVALDSPEWRKRSDHFPIVAAFS
jgi:endonuclease/exonuclease/phosphatase family metal-dependent hydrolase